jgi:hypothetical protein
MQGVHEVHIMLLIQACYISFRSIISPLASKCYHGSRFCMPSFVHSGVMKMEIQVIVTVN